MFKATLSTITLALYLVNGASSADVAFSSPFISNGAIHQTYVTTRTDLPIYYDVVRSAPGAKLFVASYGPKPSLALPDSTGLGTPFHFLPTKSAYMGYTQSTDTLFGHIALSSNTTLHLTVTPKDSNPHLAVARTADDVTQLEQFWSLQTASGVLTFLGSVYSSALPFVAVGYEPLLPVSPPEPVVITQIFNTTGRFVFQGKAIDPCPPGPIPATVGDQVIVCPLNTQ